MPEMLKKELETYEREREALLGTAEGKFVLIHGEEVLGTFDTQQDAIGQGYKQLGNVPFLVKQVVQVEVPFDFVSNLMRAEVILW